MNFCLKIVWRSVSSFNYCLNWLAVAGTSGPPPLQHSFELTVSFAAPSNTPLPFVPPIHTRCLYQNQRRPYQIFRQRSPSSSPVNEVLCTASLHPLLPRQHLRSRRRQTSRTTAISYRRAVFSALQTTRVSSRVQHVRSSPRLYSACRTACRIDLSAASKSPT